MKKSLAKKVMATAVSAVMMLTAFAGCGTGNAGNAGIASVGSETGNSTASSGTENNVGAETAGSNFNETGYPIVNDPITLKVMAIVRDVDTLMPPNDMPIIKRLEEQTGIHVEWEIIKGSDADMKVNLMFASGDYADVILCPNSKAVDDEEFGVTQKLLVPLGDLTEKYMPTYMERVNAEDDDPTVSLIASDGEKYSVGYLVGQKINTNQPFYINQTWLDTLGLSTPNNIDELTDVLRAFKAGDPSGTGKGVPLEMGLDTGFYGVRYMLPLFGIPCDPDKWIFIDENKQIQATPTQAGFRECMEWLHMLYQEELLDPEVISQDVNTIETKLKEGDVGFFTAWRLVSMGFDDGVARDCVLYTPDSSANLYRYLELAKKGAFVTANNPYIPETMRWLDTLLDTETMYCMYYGEENDAWKYNDDNGKIDILITDTTGVRDCLDCNTLFFAPGRYISEVFNMPESRIEKTASSQAYEDAGIIQKYSNDYLRMAPLTSEQIQSSSLKETDIDNAVVEHMAIFITSGVTEDSWNSFIKIFDNMSMSDYIKMYQDALDQMDIK